MKIENFTRRPFDVQAVQVTPQNAEEVAEWCGGKVGQDFYKIAGFPAKLCTVMVPGNGPNEGKHVQARIGSWVVEHIGQFRVYRKQQFQNDFVKPVADTKVFTEPPFATGDLVEDIDPKSGYFGWQGQVEFVNQTCVSIPAVGGVMYNPFDLKRIHEYSNETLLRIEQEARLAAMKPDPDSHEALEKINALRAAAEAAIMEGDLPIPHAPRTDATDRIVKLAGELDALPEEPVTEINGIKTGYEVRVKLEANMYYGETGTVVGLGKDGVRVLVVLTDLDGSRDLEPVPFQADELEMVRSAFRVDDLVKVMDDGNGETGLVTAVDVVHEDGTVEVLFGKDTKYYYMPQQIVRVGHRDRFKQDDMVETLNSLTNTAGTKMPPGTTGRVTVTGIDSPVDESIEVLFSDGGYGCFRPDELKKI